MLLISLVSTHLIGDLLQVFVPVNLDIGNEACDVSVVSFTVHHVNISAQISHLRPNQQIEQKFVLASGAKSTWSGILFESREPNVTIATECHFSSAPKLQ